MATVIHGQRAPSMGLMDMGSRLKRKPQTSVLTNFVQSKAPFASTFSALPLIRGEIHDLHHIGNQWFVAFCKGCHITSTKDRPTHLKFARKLFEQSCSIVKSAGRHFGLLNECQRNVCLCCLLYTKCTYAIMLQVNLSSGEKLLTWVESGWDTGTEDSLAVRSGWSSSRQPSRIQVKSCWESRQARS